MTTPYVTFHRTAPALDRSPRRGGGPERWHLPAFAQAAPQPDCSAIHFDLSNPAPGSRVEQGNFILSGVASDSRAQQGQGIDRVDFFLDDRDQGGLSLGTTVPSGIVGGPFGPNSFQATLLFPQQTGGHNLVAYAHSSVNGQTSILSVPIVVGEDPSKVNMQAGAATVARCQGGTQTTSTTTATGATTPAQPAPAPSTSTTTAPAPSTSTATAPAPAGSASTIVVDVSNPNPGDTVKTGAIVLSGDAHDTAATSGPGIDRIDIFLDDRDSGGLFLGSAQLGPASFWQATVTLPNNQVGLHTLNFYTHSSVSGATTVTSVPITTER